MASQLLARTVVCLLRTESAYAMRHFASVWIEGVPTSEIGVPEKHKRRVALKEEREAHQAAAYIDEWQREAKVAQLQMQRCLIREFIDAQPESVQSESAHLKSAHLQKVGRQEVEVSLESGEQLPIRSQGATDASNRTKLEKERASTKARKAQSKTPASYPRREAMIVQAEQAAEAISGALENIIAKSPAASREQDGVQQSALSTEKRSPMRGVELSETERFDPWDRDAWNATKRSLDRKRKHGRSKAMRDKMEKLANGGGTLQEVCDQQAITPEAVTPKAADVRPGPYFIAQIEELLLGKRRQHEITKAGYSIKLERPLDNEPKHKLERAADVTMFALEPKLIVNAQKASEFPKAGLPEIAFAGRSNVGKSSLINTLSRQPHVAKVSSKPGETQTINFHAIGSRLSLVDLPGYGFAFAANDKREQWTELVEQYLKSRKTLKRVMLVVDARHGLMPKDRELMEVLERSNVRFQIVLTKADLVQAEELARHATQVQQAVDQRSSDRHINPIAMVSSRNGAGLLKLRAALSGLAVRS